MPNPGAPPNAPDISVQLVHIEGPRKGEIDELQKPIVTIGRLPDSDVVFPRNLRIVSRRHAEIKREGNRFLLVNHSPNGCFVNGHRVDTTYLRQGDVVTFAEGGPKVSFLWEVLSPAKTTPGSPPPSPRRPSPENDRPAPSPPRPGPPAPSREPGAGSPGPFTIQYGTSIRSLKQPAVRLGTDPSSDFVLEHPRVFGTHAEISFRGGGYYLRDLTESQATILNDRPVKGVTPLHEHDVITFGDGGPRLRYLGTGRFAEVVE